jgi:MAX dimerization protein
MNIDAILKAADYIERQEREAEHGYAISRHFETTEHVRRRRLSTSACRLGKSTTNGLRSSHNELEKNRRAYLRNCLERLKDVVPLGHDTTRHTTLQLLTDAKLLIKQLELADCHQRQLMQQLQLEQRQLRLCLEQLTAGQYRVHSLSESSTASSLSSSEHDEIDVVEGSVSDADDRSICLLSTANSHLTCLVLSMT